MQGGHSSAGWASCSQISWNWPLEDAKLPRIPKESCSIFHPKYILAKRHTNTDVSDFTYLWNKRPWTKRETTQYFYEENTSLLKRKMQ